jgi:hypothetical protein
MKRPMLPISLLSTSSPFLSAPRVSKPNNFRRSALQAFSYTYACSSIGSLQW